ncbi:MAG: hypothetical protein ABIR68_13770 [Ilumatobacteraceae bacterium]
MLWSPLGPDEGGYLAVARGWAAGATLYRDVWVDRPQGLLVLFRVWDWLSGGSAGSVRLMAMLFGAVLVVATAVAVRTLTSEVAARVTAVVCAVVTSTPVLEGYAANGELLAGTVAVVAIAAGAVGVRQSRSLGWWFTVGVLAASAVSLKQSAFDGLVVVGGWLTFAVLRHGPDRGAWVRRLGAFGAGMVVPIGVLMVHAGFTGWGRWWWAVAEYRMKTQSALSSPDWHNLGRTAPVVTVALGLVLVAAVCGASMIVADAVRAPRREFSGSVMLLVWPVVAAVAIMLGGGFWPHYWLQLGAPLSALAGVALGRFRRLMPVLLTGILAPALAISMWVYAGPRPTWMVRAADDWRAPLNERVADWFDAHEPHPNLYVLCASAALYAEAGAIPHYPYLWDVEVHHGPHAQRLLVDYIGDSARGPRFVAQFQSPARCDSSGRVARILARDFHIVTRVSGVTILERNQPMTDARWRIGPRRLRGNARSTVR